MNVLDRLKLELSNKEYFSDEQYTQFLTENSLSATEEYDKQTMQKALLLTVIDVLEAVANDTDIMQSISTEFTTVGAAYKYIEQRIGQIKDKIASIPEPDEEYSCFSLMYTRGDDTPARTPSTGGGGGSCDCEDTTSISNLEIDKWF
nr:MAG TPA: hypothetical protein [Caudoviricetes sp.]